MFMRFLRLTKASGCPRLDLSRIVPALAAVMFFTAHGSFAASVSPEISIQATTETETKEQKLEICPPQKSDPDHYLPFTPESPVLDSPIDIGTTEAAPAFYIAPFGVAGTQGTTESSSFRHLLRFHLTPGNFTDAKWINIMPDTWIARPYKREDGHDERLIRPRSSYYRDAQLLQAHIYVDGHFQTTSSGLDLQLYCKDMFTGREQNFHEQAPQWSPDFLRKAVTDVATFCGLTQQDIDKSGLLNGAPGKSINFLLTDNSYDPAEFAAAAATDPDCLFIYRRAAERTGHYGINFINKGVQVHGKDARIIFAKSWSVITNGHGHAGMVLQAPLVKQWPQSFVYLGSYSNSCKFCYKQFAKSYAPPPNWTSAISMQADCLKIWPDNWCLYDDVAGSRGHLASHVRSSNTINKIPEQALDIHRDLTDQSMHDALRAVELRNDCPDLLSNALSAFFDAGNSEIKEQLKLLDLILKVDPSNTTAESTIAYSHSAGWDDPRVGLMFIAQRLKARKDNAYAIASLFDDFTTAINRLFGFEVTTKEKFLVKDNPILQTYVQVGEQTITSHTQSRAGSYVLLLEALHALDQDAKAAELAESLDSPNFTYAYALQLNSQKKYDDALRLSRAIQPMMDTAALRINNRVLTFSCLVSLKRPKEALDAAKDALQHSPDSAQANHMMARALEDLDQDIPSAIAYAEKAVQRGPDEEAYQNTLRRLRKKQAHPEAFKK